MCAVCFLSVDPIEGSSISRPLFYILQVYPIEVTSIYYFTGLREQHGSNKIEQKYVISDQYHNKILLYYSCIVEVHLKTFSEISTTWSNEVQSTLHIVAETQINYRTTVCLHKRSIYMYVKATLIIALTYSQLSSS